MVLRIQFDRREGVGFQSGSLEPEMLPKILKVCERHVYVRIGWVRGVSRPPIQGWQGSDWEDGQ
jgi:hypothetical protein